MKLTFKEFLTEADNKIGVVIMTNKGKFYDVSVVNYDTLEDLPSPSHAHNLGTALINIAKKTNSFAKIEPLLKSVSKAKTLGPDYTDEADRAVVYGPFTSDTLNKVVIEFENEVVV